MAKDKVKVYCTESGVIRPKERFKAILLYDRKKNKRKVIASEPVEVTKSQYETLKKNHGKKIALWKPEHRVQSLKLEDIKSIKRRPAKKPKSVQKKKTKSPAKKPPKPKGLLSRARGVLRRR